MAVIDSSVVALGVGLGSVILAQLFTTYQSSHRDRVQKDSNTTLAEQAQRTELNTNIWNLVHALQEDVSRQRIERQQDNDEWTHRLDDLETQVGELTRSRGTLKALIRDLLEVVRSKHVELPPRLQKDIEAFQKDNH
jgi:polyhydroxyalkanoate synthesis regulator phasin